MYVQCQKIFDAIGKAFKTKVCIMWYAHLANLQNGYYYCKCTTQFSVDTHTHTHTQPVHEQMYMCPTCNPLLSVSVLCTSSYPKCRVSKLMWTWMCVCTCNSCKTLIGVHEMHGLATILLAHDPLSLLAYSMITHTPPVAGNLPIKTLVARQWPTSMYMLLVYMYVPILKPTHM